MLPSLDRRAGYLSQEYEARVRETLQAVGIQSMNFDMTFYVSVSWYAGRPVEACIEKLVASASERCTNPS